MYYLRIGPMDLYLYEQTLYEYRTSMKKAHLKVEIYANQLHESWFSQKRFELANKLE